MDILSFKSLIFYMKFKGIRFEHTSEIDAMKTLEFKNYYFKISNYKNNFIPQRINYQGDKSYRYIDLDFKNLEDLASLDMQLRYIILKMCLDIEHSIKLTIMKVITVDEKEDGKSIIHDFFNYIKRETKIKDPYYKMLKYVKRDNVLSFEYYKYENNPPIWFFIEHIQFGDLCWFVEFLYTEKSYEEFERLNSVIKLVKNIRNKAAHNSPILNNIVIKNQMAGQDKNRLIVEFTKDHGVVRNTIKNRLTNYNVHDLLAMFYVYKAVVTSSGMKRHRSQELRSFMDRAKKECHIYDERFKSVYNLFNKIVDKF